MTKMPNITSSKGIDSVSPKSQGSVNDGFRPASPRQKEGTGEMAGRLSNLKEYVPENGPRGSSHIGPEYRFSVDQA